MLRRISTLVILLIGLLAAPAAAGPDDIAQYDLSLFGYRLGMSYDEAAEVRPIQRVDLYRQKPDNRPVLLACIDNSHIEGIELQLQLYFRKERLFKVVAHVQPLQFTDLQEFMVAAYGTGHDLSRVIQGFDGASRKQTIYRWDFPGARIFQLQSSDNQDFATASLLAVSSAPPETAAPQPTDE